MSAKHLPKISPGTHVIMENQHIQLLTIDINDKYENIYLLAILMKLLGIEATRVHDEVRHVFAKK